MMSLAKRKRARKQRPTTDIKPDTASRLSSEEEVCRWALRLLLPLILALCGQLIFWMWFDDIYGPNTWSIVGGCVLAVVALPVALWTWHSWLPDESDGPAVNSGIGLGKQSAVATLLTILMVGGCADVNNADSPRDNVQITQAKPGLAKPGLAGTNDVTPRALPAMSR